MPTTLTKSVTIQQACNALNNKLAVSSADKIAKLEESNTLTETAEIAAHQAVRSQAHTMGRISMTDATWLYKMLGEVSGDIEIFNSYPLADRIIALGMLDLLTK